MAGLLLPLFAMRAAPALAPDAMAQTTGYGAYTVYTYNGGPQGMAGRITDDGRSVTVTRNLTTGLNGDPQVEGVEPSDGKLRIAVTNRVAEPGAAPRTFIYNAARAANPPPVASPTWPNVRNMFGLVRLGDHLYAIDYDNGRVVEINRKTFAETGVTYTLPAGLTPNGFISRGQALAVVDGALYGLFSFPDASFANYADSLLVRFTIKGGVSIKVKAADANAGLVKNAFALVANGAELYVAGIGGSQSGGGYNKASRLQKVAAAGSLAAADVVDVFKPSKQNPYEIRDVSFRGSTAYLLIGAYDRNFTLQGKLVSTKNFAKLKTIDDFTSGAPGYFWAAQYVADNDRIYYGRGDQIRVLDAADPDAPVATLTLSPGSLISSGDPYDNINDFAYVGARGSTTTLRGYRSPTQISAAARALSHGKPELPRDERDRR